MYKAIVLTPDKIIYYVLNDRIPADNVNECETNNGGCEQICTDTPSSFQCSCNAGFTLSGDGMTCMDNDECDTGMHSCEQVCVNTLSGFRCECDPGFEINPDQETCSGNKVNKF